MTMANEEHLKILKQGVEAWNRWREENPTVWPDLSRMDLSRTPLSQADLSRTDLSEAHLTWADLSRANLSGANLMQADLSGANLSEVDLNGTELFRADLVQADLRGANLRGADFRGADLRGANLRGADLSWGDLRQADLSGANLRGTDLSMATVGTTTFANLDLTTVKGLEAMRHIGPSTIGIDTLARSRGQIPEAFLRGCGLSDWEIEATRLYQPDLSSQKISDILYRIHDLRAQQAIQVNSLFISYSRANGPFVERLEGTLNEKGVRFWRDVHDATAGRLEKQIDRAMRLNPTVLLVLSADSVQSDWVEHEARLARELEKELGRDVLCPVALDDAWKTCRWPERLREQIMEYNILDFSAWQDEAFFRRMSGKLVEGLDLFYKGE
jgi:hypothetical protein